MYSVPLFPPHLRLLGRRIRNADRRAGQDSRALEHQHDAPLRQILRDGHRPRDGGFRRAAGVGGFGRITGRRGLGRDRHEEKKITPPLSTKPAAYRLRRHGNGASGPYRAARFGRYGDNRQNEV